MFQKSHALTLGGILLLLAVIFEIVSATQYPKVPIHMTSSETTIKQVENINRFHNLALVLAIVGIGVTVNATAMAA